MIYALEFPFDIIRELIEKFRQKKNISKTKYNFYLKFHFKNVQVIIRFLWWVCYRKNFLF